MLKIRENKTRKKLRITQCVLFLLEILFCAFSFIHIPNPEGGWGFHATVIDMFGYIGGSIPAGSEGEAFSAVIPFFFIFPVLPIIGFFFCALDKERNMKNVVSILICLLGVFAILNIIPLNFLDYGSTFALLGYILISFISAIAIMARFSDNSDSKSK